ncbi:MAG TPA: TM2 domain-containing protein [Bacteroidia bacterium]|jgi:hypothetical protein|nr:TM2 domain-containing protein [Bacteroidia bacterium]
MLNEDNGHAEQVSASLRSRNKFGMTVRFLIFFFLFFSLNIFSEKKEVWLLDSTGTVLEKQFVELKQTEFSDKAPNPLFKLFRKKHKDHRRIIAAVLAFPFPFGIVGLHRIFLGTKPYVPVVYIATLGGIFGILPLIDFFAIIFDKDFEHYENNGKVLMWVK